MNEKVKTFKKEIWEANVLSVEVGTNTPMGGDAGHGGITIFTLTNKAATSWLIDVFAGRRKEEGNAITIENPDQISIKLFGDTEAKTFMEALKFALHILKVQRSTKEKENK